MLYDKRWDEKKVETKPVEPWRDVLRRAADIMDERGLAKGTVQDGRGHVCLLGAINVARGGCAFGMEHESLRLVNRVSDYLALSGWPHSAISWNNEPERTQAEVVAALRAAASA